MKLINGDCLEKLKELADNSVDAIVTDPPAGISFMNKEWDSNKGGRDEWMQWLTEVMTEAKRVLKHGGHALVWAIPRTSHWTAMAIENAGFEVRDCVYHIQSQGFPKSLNVSKAIDKKFGAEREVIRSRKLFGGGRRLKGVMFEEDGKDTDTFNYTAPATDKAKQYDGYGSQLKPAVECWWLCRKPLAEKNIVDNVLKHGTGAINIDKSRIPTENPIRLNEMGNSGSGVFVSNNGNKESYSGNFKINTTGRFPANLIHDGSDAVMEEFNKYGESKSSKAEWKPMGYNAEDSGWKRPAQNNYQPVIGGYDDSGSVARFFYCSKASVSERNTGLDGFEEKEVRVLGNGAIVTGSQKEDYKVPPQKNNHPTVKPVKLMSYLVNLIAPPYKSVILDMFMGTGSTGIAALLNGHDFIGIEMSEEYMKIAEARINNYEEFRKYLK